MRAGRLRYRITIQSPIDVPDGKGGQARTWEPLISRRAGQEVKGSRIFHALSQRYTQFSHVFRLRKIDVPPHCRLMFQGTPHRIVGLEEQGRELLILTESEQRTTTYGH